MLNRMLGILTYRTRMPWLLLVRLSIPLFLVVLAVATLLGAPPFWAAVTAAFATIAGQVVIDAVWRREHRSGPDPND